MRLSEVEGAIRGTYESLELPIVNCASSKMVSALCSPDLPSLRAELPERNSLLWRQVNDDEAIDTGLLAVSKETLLAVCAQRVVVSHQHHWGPEPLFPCIADHLEGRGEGDSILEGNLGFVSGCLGTGWARLTVFAVWMVGPSAIGSVKGTPSSITSRDGRPVSTRRG